VGLYLCVFRGEEELDGVEVGAYDDWERFRDEARALDGRLFRRFGTLRLAVSETSAWSARQAARLDRELEALAAQLRARPPRPLRPGSWQEEVARARGLSPATLLDCYFDVTGAPLVARLRELCRLAVAEGQPILFQ
jgi:hypothetical protein